MIIMLFNFNNTLDNSVHYDKNIICVTLVLLHSDDIHFWFNFCAYWLFYFRIPVFIAITVMGTTFI